MSGSIDRKKNVKSSLKEKVLQIYDKLFQGQDITQGRAEFWDDFFLLKVNLKCLNTHFEKTSVDDLIILKPQLDRLLLQCLHTAQHEQHRIRIANAIQTMDALIAGVYRCKMSPDSSVHVNDMLLSDDQAKEFMQRYVLLCTEMFREERPERLRSLILNSMRTLLVSNSDQQSNLFAMGLLNVHIFSVLRLILVNAQLRYHHGLAACKLLGLLNRLSNHDHDNPFSEQGNLTDDELLLNGLSSTISLALSEYNLLFRQQHDPSVGFLSSMSSFIGSIFVGDMASNVSLRPCDSLLMCIYAITKDGTHFSSILSYSNAHCDTASGFDSLSMTGSLRDETIRTFGSDPLLRMNGPRNHVGDDANEQDTTELADNANAPMPNSSLINTPSTEPVGSGDLFTINDRREVDSPYEEQLNGEVADVHLEPRNLLADLLEYCSIIMQDATTTESLNSCQICLIIVLSITQNPLACSLLHDPHLTFKVWIHKQRSRYRKTGPTTCANLSGRPIAVAIMSLVVEFMRGHLMKKLPHRLYSIACSICHNLLCYQTNRNIRLDFDWKQLWSALFSLLQFILHLDNNSLPALQAFELMNHVLRIFNFCILFGDHFLQAADVYDDLYYELIRMRNLFENIYEYGLIHSTGTNLELKPVAGQVVSQMRNIRSIVNHFNAKINAFSAANSLTSLTESQVLAVVRDNYDSLNLRVYENLDISDVYDELLDESLFDSLVETVIKQTRKECWDKSLQLQSHFHELSVIH